MSLVSIHNLSCERDDRVLFRGLDHHFNHGSIVQLEGPNGAGKTTLLRIIAGLYHAHEGEVKFEGKPIRHDLSSYHQHLLFIGHKTGIKQSLTVLENISYLAGMHAQYKQSELMWALEQVGLGGFEHSYCRNLSAGQQRRVALARLYLSKAPVWILDEVFTAIDKHGVAQFEQLLVDRANSGACIIFTTHHQLAIEGLQVLSL